MIPVIISRCKIEPNKKVREITAKEREALVENIKYFRLDIKGFRGIEEAVITAGGISLKEVDPKTMMSKNIDNLYFVGEILDVDGYTGGFNLGIAFATGAAAGRGIANNLLAINILKEGFR